MICLTNLERLEVLRNNIKKYIKYNDKLKILCEESEVSLSFSSNSMLNSSDELYCAK